MMEPLLLCRMKQERRASKGDTSTPAFRAKGLSPHATYACDSTADSAALSKVQHHIEEVKGPHLSQAAVRGAALCISFKLAAQATQIRGPNEAGLLQGHARQGSKK